MVEFSWISLLRSRADRMAAESSRRRSVLVKGDGQSFQSEVSAQARQPVRIVQFRAPKRLIERIRYSHRPGTQDCASLGEWRRSPPSLIRPEKWDF
jgi:hypothetical protein